MSEFLTKSLSESILTALFFSNHEKTNVMVNQLEPRLFDQAYVDIADRVLVYRRKFDKAPGSEHIDDIFDDILSSKSDRRANFYRNTLTGMLQQADGLNIDYITSRVSTFCRQQILKEGVLRAAEQYTNAVGDEEEVIENVERILLETVRNKVNAEDMGTFLSDKARILNFLSEEPADYTTIGISELTKKRLHIFRKELLLFMAARKRGKTWFVIHCGKYALMQKWRVCHISLEVSEKILVQRYIQSFFSAARSNDFFRQTFIDFDTLNRATRFRTERLRPNLSFDDPELRQLIEEKLDAWGVRLSNLIIKEYPSGRLTVNQLESYLDSLEIVHKFTPDLLIVDYPQLMQIDVRNPVISLGQTVVNLRRIASERNMAVICPAQGTREAETSNSVHSGMTAGDISLVATADSVLTYSQTQQERDYGLARLFVNNARNAEDRYNVLITQNYKTGQFCLNSCPVVQDYNDKLKDLAGNTSDKGGTDDDEC